jgi:hypothetical protein
MERRIIEKLPSAAKAGTGFVAHTAWLKPCPFKAEGYGAANATRPAATGAEHPTSRKTERSS